MAGFPGFDLSNMSGSPSFTGGAGGSATGGTTGAATSMFDSSGWTVGTGKAKVTGSGGMSPWMIGGLVAAGLVAVWMITRK